MEAKEIKTAKEFLHNSYHQAEIQYKSGLLKFSINEIYDLMEEYATQKSQVSKEDIEEYDLLINEFIEGLESVIESSRGTDSSFSDIKRVRTLKKLQKALNHFQPNQTKIDLEKARGRVYNVLLGYKDLSTKERKSIEDRIMDELRLLEGFGMDQTDNWISENLVYQVLDILCKDWNLNDSAILHNKDIISKEIFEELKKRFNTIDISDEIKEKVLELSELLQHTPEINMGNISIEDVERLNNDTIEAFGMIQEIIVLLEKRSNTIEVSEDLIKDFKKEFGSVLSSDDAIQVLEAVEQWLKRSNKRETEWISVKDDLPEFKTKVLVYLDGGSVYQGYLYSISQHEKNQEPLMTWRYYTDLKGNEAILGNANFVTHWQPLPQPPINKKH